MKPARTLLAATAAALLLAGGTLALYAASVVSVTPGLFGGGDPLAMLGPPQGQGPTQGSFDVYQLGVGGQTVLELEQSAVNGPGTDLVVYENPFSVAGGLPFETYVECATVEVSTDGNAWARFPLRYDGPVGPFQSGPGTFTGADLSWYSGFAGVMPVMADPLAGVDPADVVAGGGDAFDLSDLTDDPLVLSGAVSLDAIRYVRLRDVVGGVDEDDGGTPVWDCGDPAFAGADIDAVATLNTSFNQTSGRPHVELTLDNGFLLLELQDDDGLKDIKLGLTASWNGVPIVFYDLLPIFAIVGLQSDRVLFATGPLPTGFGHVLLKVAAHDGAGLVGGDAIVFP